MKGGGLIAGGPGGSIYIRRGVDGWVGTYNLREGIFGRGGGRGLYPEGGLYP